MEKSNNKFEQVANAIDSVVSDDGLKTDLKITMTDATLLKTSLYLIGTAIVASVAIFEIKKLYH